PQEVELQGLFSRARAQRASEGPNLGESKRLPFDEEYAQALFVDRKRREREYEHGRGFVSAKTRKVGGEARQSLPVLGSDQEIEPLQVRRLLGARGRRRRQKRAAFPD